ncbi:hypothetical protein CTM_03004 [Clostridium tetanomorphum DSM 665]|nr:hypothetical protein CTM_03004 [Clostridium tetanomorphum DSM 665]SQB91479.1 DNA helicase [Clostridium tetanomorphum]
MYKSSKSAFTLIEVLCSISLFSIMLVTSTAIILNSFKLKLYNEELKEYAYFLEGLKNVILYDLDDDDFLYLNNKSKVFINENNMKLEKLKKGNLKNTLDENISGEIYTCINIKKIKNKDKYYKININLKLTEDEDIRSQFIKKWELNKDKEV